MAVPEAPPWRTRAWEARGAEEQVVRAAPSQLPEVAVVRATETQTKQLEAVRTVRGLGRRPLEEHGDYWIKNESERWALPEHSRRQTQTGFAQARIASGNAFCFRSPKIRKWGALLLRTAYLVPLLSTAHPMESPSPTISDRASGRSAVLPGRSHPAEDPILVLQRENKWMEENQIEK
ncbi:uncharacterized protein LOC110311350 [Mus caroli]|uniref:Uncharacterized protein LOC110311350 n=1 Tax=Mus caroli TaxID=10089 RepID=A0A6P5R5S4_MUSCR|nr:uncharacterized protein LOC110311350 [Mus caroli]